MHKMNKLFLTFLIVFFIISCQTDDMENNNNPFVGTWENEHSGYRTVFTDNHITVYYPDGNIYWTGTYTYNNTEIIAKLNIKISAQEMIDAANDGIFIITYWFENEKLIFNHSPLIKINN